MSYTYFVFSSRMRALQAEQLLQRHGLPAAAVQNPAATGLPCALAVRCPVQQAAACYRVIRGAGMAPVVRGCFVQTGGRLVPTPCQQL